MLAEIDNEKNFFCGCGKKTGWISVTRLADASPFGRIFLSFG
jgi:hypothetical protein